MQNGNGPVMRISTNIYTVSFSYFRKLGHESVNYAGDFSLQGNTPPECLKNVTDTVRVLRELDFVLHPEKSIMIPTQIITFFGVSQQAITCSKQQ